jgi:hypothetical protein
MRRVQMFLMFLTVSSALAPALAWAQPPVVSEPTSTARFVGATTGSGRGFGVGAVALFQPLAGDVSNTVPNILVTWGDSGGRFHLDGLFGLRHAGATDFDLGVRGWYHIHAASSADFSLGAGLGMVRRKSGVPAGADAQWDFEMEIGAQIRAFIVPNVALMGSVGMALYVPDSGDTVLQFSGSLVGTLGVAYFFM